MELVAMFKLYGTDDKLLISASAESLREDDPSGLRSMTDLLVERAIREGVDLSNVILPYGYYNGIDFKGISLKWADLMHCKFIECNLVGVDMSEALLTGVKFIRCHLWDNKLPEGLAAPQGDIEVFKVVKMPDEEAVVERPPTMPEDEFPDPQPVYAILKLFVPAAAHRIVANGNPPRLRAQYAIPMMAMDLDGNEIQKPSRMMPPQHEGEAYVLGKEYIPSGYSVAWWEACAAGVNCFLTFEEACDYASLIA